MKVSHFCQGVHAFDRFGERCQYVHRFPVVDLKKVLFARNQLHILGDDLAPLQKYFEIVLGLRTSRVKIFTDPVGIIDDDDALFHVIPEILCLFIEIMEIILQKLQVRHVSDIFAEFIAAFRKVLRSLRKVVALFHKPLHLSCVFFIQIIRRIVEDTLVRQHLLCWIHLYELEIFHRTLGIDIEGPDRVHLCIEELHSIRIVTVRRKDIDDAPSDGELSPGIDQFHPLISQFYESPLHFFRIDVIT